jgi:hypothetical protein
VACRVLRESKTAAAGRDGWQSQAFLGEAAGMPFPIHPHMLRHACGYKLANDGHDTRVLQLCLGHKSIVHTTQPRWRRIASRISGDNVQIDGGEDQERGRNGPVLRRGREGTPNSEAPSSLGGLSPRAAWRAALGAAYRVPRGRPHQMAYGGERGAAQQEPHGLP